MSRKIGFSYAISAIWLMCGCTKSMTGITNVSAVVTDVLTELPEGEHITITTREFKRIRIHYKEDKEWRVYEVLFGPNPGSGETAEGWYHTSIPTFHIDRGWAYISGDKPMGEAEVVTAIADGTSLILQVQGGVDRVYLLDRPLKVDSVRTALGSSSKQFAADDVRNTDKYVETNPPKTELLGPFNVRDTASVQSFVEYVKQRAVDARIIDASE
jgi:hypothetical protein